MSASLLSVSELRVHYGTFVAVRNMSFELEAGMLLGMIGPNGAGKTTALRAIAGLQPITTGKISVLGDDVFESPTAVGYHLALTPDVPPANENLRVRDYLHFIGACYGLSEHTRKERIDHWLERLWLSEKRDNRVSSLSRGMRQRLGVVRSLLPDPALVLMDEPASGLDPAGRIQFRELLTSLREQGKALIVSSHILADLEEVCTHALLMERGRVLRFGTIDQIASIDESEVCRYRVVLVKSPGDLSSRLERIPEIGSVTSEADGFSFEAKRDRAEASRILASLLREQIEVAEFRAIAADLEQAYLRAGIGQVD